MHPSAASELQWVMRTSPSEMWRAPISAIRSIACSECSMNSAARARTAARPSSTDPNESSARITLFTAFGSETAVGRVAMRIPAAFCISLLNVSGSDMLRFFA